MAGQSTSAAPKWIWCPTYNDYYQDTPGKFVLFRKTINLKQKPLSTCMINVSGDTRYRLFVNGVSVSFGPCKSYPARWFYETVDILPFLKEGNNVISARVLRFSAAQIGSTSMMKAPIPGFILWGDIAGQSIITDETWKCIEDKSIRLLPRSEWNYLLGPPFLSLEEDVDFKKSPPGWQSADYDDSTWSDAVISSMVTKMMPALEPWKLTKRPIPMLPELSRRFRGVLRTKSSNTDFWNSLLVGNGEVKISPNEETWVEIETDVLTTGFLSFAFHGGKGAEVEILYAESYEKDLGIEKSPFPRPRSKEDRKDYINGRLYGYEDRIVLNSTQNQATVYEPFWFRTFRFIRLSIKTSSAPLTISDVHYRETHYPLQITTSISLPQDSELRQIWNISLNTLKNCMHETYEDCPYYEQNQFAMDTRLHMLFTYQLSRDDRLARKTMQEFYASRRDDGLLETNAPMSFRAVNIPQFSLYWILMVHDHMMYFADKSLVKKYMGTIDGILQHFDDRLNNQGLVGAFDEEAWAYVDWVKEWQGTKGLRDMAVPPIYKKTGVATINSLVYAWILRHAADLADYISRPDTANEYRSRADRLNQAALKHSYNGNFFLDGPGAEEICQHTQIFAILSSAVTGDEARELMLRTMQAENLPQCSFAMKFYVFRALEKTGLYTQFWDEMMEPWRKMVRNNLTTCPEDDVSFRSDCHGWSASPIYEIVSQIYGVKPIEVGMKKMRVGPKRELLGTGEAKVAVAGGGLLAMSWKDWGDVVVQPSEGVVVELVQGEK